MCVYACLSVCVCLCVCVCVCVCVTEHHKYVCYYSFCCFCCFCYTGATKEDPPLSVKARTSLSSLSTAPQSYSCWPLRVTFSPAMAQAPTQFVGHLIQTTLSIKWSRAHLEWRSFGEPCFVPVHLPSSLHPLNSNC